MKWEYHIEELEIRSGSAETLNRSREKLKKLGEEGWELVSIPYGDSPPSDYWRVAVLKREK